jgi:hypothetical protein
VSDRRFSEERLKDSVDRAMSWVRIERERDCSHSSHDRGGSRGGQRGRWWWSRTERGIRQTPARAWSRSDHSFTPLVGRVDLSKGVAIVQVASSHYTTMCWGSTFRCRSVIFKPSKSGLNTILACASEQLSVYPSATFPHCPTPTSGLPFPSGPLLSTLSVLLVLSGGCPALGSIHCHFSRPGCVYQGRWPAFPTSIASLGFLRLRIDPSSVGQYLLCCGNLPRQCQGLSPGHHHLR